MTTTTYVPLASVTLTGSDTQVLFSSIPNTYRDLVIIFDAIPSSGENLTPTINGSSTGFTWVQMTSGLSSNSGTNNSIGSVTGGVWNIGVLHFVDYAQTNKEKTFIVRTSNTGDVRVLACRWDSTAAINQIGLSIRLGYSFNAGSTFSLYGIHG